ncbi:MAG: hypothetical protein EOO05_04190 [Chitinophagaceae bacterium]|nr:MAG: hypothetical protein EOO05_04190 [Chitinophagaceae bacterium]
MAMLDGKEFESWDHYFREKLPASQLVIDQDTNSPGREMHVRSRLIECETKLVIEFPGADTCMVTCHNPLSPLVLYRPGSGLLNGAMFESYYEFNDISLDQLDNQLNIPLYFGWTEKLDFHKGKLIEAQLLFEDRSGLHALPVEKNRTWLDKAGCLLTLFTWPVLYLQHQFVLFLYKKGYRQRDQTLSTTVPMISAG